MMKKSRLLTGAVVLCMALSMGGLSSVAAQAQENLVNVEATDMDMPGPGRSSEWKMNITLTTPKTVSLGLSFTGASATKQSILKLLTVSIVDDRGTVVLHPTLLSQLGAEPVSLGQLTDADLALTGTLALDGSADNQYQTAEGVLDFTVVATADDDPENPLHLTRTGGQDVVAWGVFGLLGLCTGALVVGVSLRRKRP